MFYRITDAAIMHDDRRVAKACNSLTGTFRQGPRSCTVSSACWFAQVSLVIPGQSLVFGLPFILVERMAGIDKSEELRRRHGNPHSAPLTFAYFVDLLRFGIHALCAA